MAADRLFITQEGLDAWLDAGLAEIGADLLAHFGTGTSFSLEPALAVTAELTGDGDDAKLVGTARTRSALEALGAEIAFGSIVLGERAYETVDGFLATPVATPIATPIATHETKSARVALDDADLDLLAVAFGG